jgi:hypothetical protein
MTPAAWAKYALSVVVIAVMRAFPVFQPYIHRKCHSAENQGCYGKEDKSARTNFCPPFSPVCPSYQSGALTLCFHR